jgi:hypothetical protein
MDPTTTIDRAMSGNRTVAEAKIITAVGVVGTWAEVADVVVLRHRWVEGVAEDVAAVASGMMEVFKVAVEEDTWMKATITEKDPEMTSTAVAVVAEDREDRLLYITLERMGSTALLVEETDSGESSLESIPGNGLQDCGEDK